MLGVITDYGFCSARRLDDSFLSADAALLQEKLDSITARNAKLEAEYLDILQDKLGLETAIQDLREPSREPEENVPFLEQRKRLQSVQSELVDLRNQHFSLTAELVGVKDRLISAENNKDVHSLDGNTEYQALVERYTELHEHSEGVETELAEQRALLRHALLNASGLTKEIAEIRSGNEYKIVVAQLQAVRAAAEESPILEDTATGLADKIEAARAAGVAARKVILSLQEMCMSIADKQMQRVEDQDAEIAKLKKAGSMQQTPSKDFAALQRENKLMTSAWFDLSSRLQSNTVMVGRRKETPKSFLGKQRAVVTPLIAGGQVRQTPRALCKSRFTDLWFSTGDDL